ncbi:MAG: fatty acid desaturase family protein [Gemmatimonadales bacterium]
MSGTTVSFPKQGAEEFVRDVKRGVADYFAETGRSMKANWSMRAKTVILLALVVVPYVAILSNRLSLLAMLGCTVVMGIGIAGIGFGISHDALHGAYANSPFVNRLLGTSLDLIGGNSYMWKLTHNVIHHTYTNIEGVDEDIDFAPFLRLSPHSRHQWQHRFQHLYAFAAYSTATLFWVFVKDYRYFLKRDLGPYKNKQHPPGEIALLFVTKAAFYGWTIVLPLLILHVTWWQFLIGFLTMQMTAGLILGVVFQLAHVVEGTEFPLPDQSGTMESAWLLHEMRTTANFAPDNRLVGWYVAGLNHQIEHHLFPKICSVHYPAISRIVRRAAAAHGVPYHEHPTLIAAIRSHYRMLKRLAQPLPIEAQLT